MILDNNVKIIVKSSRTIYELKKINICSKIGDNILLPIDKLWLKSSILIHVKCDMCNNKKMLRYSDYNINYDKYKIYCCSNKCAIIKNKKTNLVKYGVENVFQSEEIKNKSKNTCKEKYGDPNYKNFEKSKKTCKEKYGVEYSLQNNSIREKIEKTNMEKYGTKTCLSNVDIKIKIEKSNLEKYNSKYPITTVNIKKKSKQTCFEKYGDENYNNRKKYKLTCLEKYGVESTNTLTDIKTKKENTNFLRYGYINNSKSKICKEKLRKTNLDRYGVEYPMQVELFFNKQQKSSFKIKKFKNTNINYQGTYEYDFLIYCEKMNIFNLIERPKSIDYIFENKSKKYYPDFFIDKYNLIIEIKSNYTYKKELDKNISKMDKCIELGYNYIVIIDKNYKHFDKMINQLSNIPRNL